MYIALDQLAPAVGLDAVDERLDLVRVEDPLVPQVIVVDEVLDPAAGVADGHVPGRLGRRHVGVRGQRRLGVGHELAGGGELVVGRLVVEPLGDVVVVRRRGAGRVLGVVLVRGAVLVVVLGGGLLVVVTRGRLLAAGLVVVRAIAVRVVRGHGRHGQGDDQHGQGDPGQG